MNVNQDISKLVDGWCERRALRQLRTILSSWPPPNGFSDEVMQIWAAMRHIRAMNRDDLIKHGEMDSVNGIIAELSQRLFPQETHDAIEETAERLITKIFGNQRL